MAGKAYTVTHSDAEWRQILTPDQYDVMRAHGALEAGINLFDTAPLPSRAG